MGSWFVHCVLLEADKSLSKQINFGMGQRCESSSTLGTNDPTTSHTVLGQQGALLWSAKCWVRLFPEHLD